MASGNLPPWAGSGTATTVGAAVNVQSPGTKSNASSYAIRNTGATNALTVSFDGGVTYVPTLAAGESFSVTSIALATVYVKAATATTTYEWVAGS